MNSSELDIFIAGLSGDWSDYLTTEKIVQYTHLYPLEVAHGRLENLLVQKREAYCMEYKDPKPYSGAPKSKQTVIYNLRTDEEKALYASLKTPSVPSKLEGKYKPSPYLDQASAIPSSADWLAINDMFIPGLIPTSIIQQS